ncbi:MAG: endonuclease/exonuclease/phosphatase family protein [Bdellovibrio sp.]|nr:endonuclease/exonuclease/phosphatase family protein [Bdellovibrio sp.]
MKVTLAFIFFAFTYMADATTIISQNIQCGHDKIHERVELFVRQVIKLNADVVALQEICSDKNLDVVYMLKQKLEQNGFEVKFFDRLFTHLGFERFDEELALFSRLDVDKVSKGYLPPSPLRRGYLAFQIDGVWYVSTHLTHESEASTLRFKQMEFLAKKYSAQPAIISGDFNAAPDSHESRAFFELKYHPYFPGPTWPSQGPWHSYDGFWGNFYNSQSPKTQLLEDIGSDHLGVALNFK